MDAKREKNLKLFVNVGRTADLMRKGYSVSEIVDELKLNESTVRTYIGYIEKAMDNGYQAKK